jgi:hypothetical protein
MFGIAIICGTAVTLQHWEAIDKENNAFAKDCNDRGGKVVFGMHARQCIGAGPTKNDKEK